MKLEIKRHTGYVNAVAEIKNTYIYRNNLIGEKVKSCGCITKRHEMAETKLYSVWANMKYRCNTPSCHAYHNYGGKGVKVCEEWNDDFLSFYKWAIENGYKEGLTIDRIDSNGDYEPSNCRWVTLGENVSKSNKSPRRKADKGTYFGISPNNEYVEFENANKFAKENNLNAGVVRAVARGEKYKNSTYKGWRFGYVSDIIK